MEILLFVLTGLGVVTIILLVVLLVRNPQSKLIRLEGDIRNIQGSQDRTERVVKEEIAKNREEMADVARQDREEVSRQFKNLGHSILSGITEMSSLQKNQLDTFSKQLSSLTSMNEQKLENIRNTVEERLKALQDENARKLEQMRETVDEKLHATLEKRLGESFKLVSDQLEEVHKGLGEMQTLAVGVGDLKKVLANIRTRGTWGEIQLGNLLEQVLTKDQYDTNVATRKDSEERVEFAIKLPGREDDHKTVWLPIDAKFPLESYQKLLDAQDAGDVDAVKEWEQALEKDIKVEAKRIMTKYIDPPNTTDFGIMFLPVEGLYAEVLRRPGLCELLQRECRIVLTGPTTIAALLNSLQMGFRTLAVEKRASEVWQTLGVIKTEFGKFGDILDKTHKKLEEASSTIEKARGKTRTIEKKLRDVQELPAPETTKLIEES